MAAAKSSSKVDFAEQLVEQTGFHRLPSRARLPKMLLILAGLLLASAVYPGPEGRIISLYGRGFSFQLLEPEGWVLDTKAAPQISNFIFHPTGVNWRQADAIIVARFVPRDEKDDLNAFLEKNDGEFLKACPFGEVDRAPDQTGNPEPFVVRSFACPGVRDEIVAVGPFPGYFVVFALSSSKGAAVEDATPVFRAILESFRWVELPDLSPPLKPRREPGNRTP